MKEEKKKERKESKRSKKEKEWEAGRNGTDRNTSDRTGTGPRWKVARPSC
jgi:hypothetical protein